MGEEGKVVALERSQRFSDIMRSVDVQRGFETVISPNVMDLVEDRIPSAGIDAFWIRWVLAFVSDPSTVI